MKYKMYMKPSPNLNFLWYKRFRRALDLAKLKQGFKVQLCNRSLEVSLCKQMTVLHEKREENSSYSACRRCGLQSLWVSSLSWMSRCSVCESFLHHKGEEQICLFHPLHIAQRRLTEPYTTPSHKAERLGWDVCLEYQDNVLYTNKCIQPCALVH